MASPARRCVRPSARRWPAGWRPQLVWPAAHRCAASWRWWWGGSRARSRSRPGSRPGVVMPVLHVLFLGQHAGGYLQRSRCLVARDAGGAATECVDALLESATCSCQRQFCDRRARVLEIAHTQRCSATMSRQRYSPRSGRGATRPARCSRRRRYLPGPPCPLGSWYVATTASSHPIGCGSSSWSG